VIQATRKTGFLIEDGATLGRAIVLLRDSASSANDRALRNIADWLDAIQVQTYYEPVQPKLITEQIEEVA
jgi:hypothetical protein